MNNAQMRAYVAGLYPGKWAAKVNRMSDAQVYRIFQAKRDHDNETQKKEQR